MSLISLARRGRALALVAGVLMVMPLAAEARPGGGKSMGSRGGFSREAPPPTATTPGGGQSFQRSAPSPSMGAPAAGAAAAQAARPSFARNLMMGIGAGLLGAGLFGLLSGAGFGGLAGFIGLLFQAALIAGAIWLVLRFFRRRAEPQLAGAGAPVPRDGLRPEPQNSAARMGMLGGASAASAAVQPQPIELQGDDFNAFERLLGEVNAAYSNEDEAGLRQRVTPEMFGYFDEDLTANVRRGVADRVSDVKLLQGDLAQAWHENGFDYATVAMRFSLINAMYDRKTGALVEGDAKRPQEVKEYWTFQRERGGQWKLSAIQQSN